MSYTNRFPPSKNTRYRSSWGPGSVTVFHQRADIPRLSPEEEEYAEHCREILRNVRRNQLIPMQEDLADWINKTLNIDCLTVDNFFDVLDNGAILYRLGKVIGEKARAAVDAGIAKGPVPAIQGRCWEKAARGSFFSRDNMENFIQFCRKLGLHQNLLFESDDLVLQGNPKNVLTCLFNVAKVVSKRYDIEPPELVRFERDIEAEQERDHCLSDSGISNVSWQYQSPSPAESPGPPSDTMKHSRSVIEMSTSTSWLDSPTTPTMHQDPPGGSTNLLHEDEEDEDDGGVDVADHHDSHVVVSGKSMVTPGSDGVPSSGETTEDDWSRGSPDDPEDEGISPARSPSPTSSTTGGVGTGGREHHVGPLTELDKKVLLDNEVMSADNSGMIGQNNRGLGLDDDGIDLHDDDDNDEIDNAAPRSLGRNDGCIHDGVSSSKVKPDDEGDYLKVRRAAEAVQRMCQCPSERCNKLKVRKVGEGLFHIAGRNVFVRVLKGKHMMVRVGGGWETLDHFLTRHDPCQVRLLSRESTPAQSPRNRSSESLNNLLRNSSTNKHSASTNFLHIRAKYRSSPSVANTGLPLPAR